jgi:hypothetical protein
MLRLESGQPPDRSIDPTATSPKQVLPIERGAVESPEVERARRGHGATGFDRSRAGGIVRTIPALAWSFLAQDEELVDRHPWVAGRSDDNHLVGVAPDRWDLRVNTTSRFGITRTNTRWR